MKELEKKQTAQAPAVNTSWGASEGIDSSDLITPMLLIGQSVSDAVKDGEVKYGEMYDSLTRTVLAKKNEAIDVIVFKARKKWFIEKLVGTKMTFLKFEDFTPENANEPFNYEINGEQYQRSMVLEFFCLLASDIAKDKESAFPYALSLMKTNRHAGKIVATICSKLKMIGKSSASVTFTVNAKTQMNESQQEYYVFDIKQGRATTDEEQAIAKKWYDMTNSIQIKVDNPNSATASTAAKVSKNKIEDDLQF